MSTGANDSKHTIYEKEPTLRPYKMPLKSPKQNTRRMTYKIKDRKGDKGSNSRNLGNNVYGSTGKINHNCVVIPSSSMHALTMDDMRGLYTINNLSSPNSGSTKVTTKSNKKLTTKFSSPNGPWGNPKTMTTENMFTMFKDMSKRVAENLNDQQDILETKNKSKFVTSQKNIKSFRKFGMIPPSGRMNSGGSKEKCTKRDANFSKSKIKMSTRRKTKGSHKNSHRLSASRTKVGSIEHARTINKYLNKWSLRDNAAEEPATYDLGQEMTQSQMSATAPIQFAEIYEKKLQQQEMLVIIEEEKQRQREKEILKEVEEKLERDYKYYQHIKNPDGSSDTPSELGIKKAAESTLDNLWESHETLKSVLTLIKVCFNDYIGVVEQKAQKFELMSNEKDQKLIDIQKELDKQQDVIDCKNAELESKNKMMLDFKSSLKAKSDKIIKLEKDLDEKPKMEKENVFMGKFDQSTICAEIKELLSENEDLKAFATEMRGELEYGKQRENKLMYFLFLLQQKDYPVFDVFETYVKDLSTQRFSTELDEEYKHIYVEQMRKLKELGMLENSFTKSERRTHTKLNKEDDGLF